MSRFELGKQCYELKSEGYTNQQIVEQLGISNDRRVRELVAYYTELANVPRLAIINQHIRLDEVSEVSYDELEKIEAHDLDQFISYLQDFNKEYIKVAIINDLHVPYQEDRAVDLTLQILSDFQPDLINDGSDVMDLDNISRWPQTAFDQVRQVWETNIIPYQQWRKQLRQVVPKHRSFFLPGNHDMRYLDWVRTRAPQFYYKEKRDFVKSIRQTGTWFLGEHRDIVTIGQLAIVHGTTAGKQPAKALWDRLGYNYQVTVAGHVHRKSVFEVSGYLENTLRGVSQIKTRVAATTGCLCKQRPQYNFKQTGENWSHGFAVAIVEKNTGEVVGFENLELDVLNGRAAFGGKIYKI